MGIVVANTPPVSLSSSFLQKLFLEASKKADNVKLGDIEYAFVSLAKSRALNDEYAGNNYSTDVLSFAYREKDGQINGQVFICTTIAKTQAKKYSLTLKEEICILMTHGLLHVLGLDHQTAAQQARFLRLQDGIIEKIGMNTREMQWLA